MSEYANPRTTICTTFERIFMPIAAMICQLRYYP